MNDIEKYRRFSESEKTIPIFSKGWWLDAVCPGEWDVFLLEENKQIIAALPFHLSHFNGKREIRKAPLTQTNGVWIRYPENQKYEKKIRYEIKLMDFLIDKIESLNLSKYQQYFHYSMTNWLPFYWKGYSQTTRYTYVIQDTSNINEIYQNLDSNIRKLLRKSEKIVQVKEDLEIDEFYTLNQLTYERQNLEVPYSYDVILRIDRMCKERNARKILYCVDEYKQIHAAAYFIWDEQSVYYLMSGSNPKYRHSQALTLLLYEGIKLANQFKKKFDFEGSMKKNIERHFRQFGAIQIPYHNIYKEF